MDYRSISLVVLLSLFIPLITIAASGYELGAGDRITITVYGSPELDTEERLSQSGHIRFPFLGEVEIGGLTESAAETKLARLVQAQGIVRNPQINILIDEYRSHNVAVVGHVAKPGEYYLTRESTITDLLAKAGWIQASGADYINVISKENGGKNTQKLYVEDVFNSPERFAQRISAGDTIYVPRMEVFYIQGAVRQPGAYRLKRNMTLMQGLSQAGGLTETGNRDNVVVTRQVGHGGGMQKLNLDLTDKLLPDDVVYVKESIF